MLLLPQTIPVTSGGAVTQRPSHGATNACVLMGNSTVHISDVILGGAATIAQLVMLLVVLLVVLPINRTIYAVTAITPAGSVKAWPILFVLLLTQPLGIAERLPSAVMGALTSCASLPTR